MKCWVCHRQARGYGCSDLRFAIGDPRRYPPDQVFCSMRCQDIFSRMYGKWFAKTPALKEVFMIDATDIEVAAMKKCLKSFGEAAGEIGFDKPLGAYSEAEALRIIEAIVTCYTEAMVAEHEAIRQPPIRSNAPVDFADFKDDLPWEK